jgi:hypothetical protein
MLLGLFDFPVAIKADGEPSRETRVVATRRQPPSSRQTLWAYHRNMLLFAGGEFF